MKHKGPRALPALRHMQEPREFGVQVARAESLGVGVAG
jgi:hypothetical protein